MSLLATQDALLQELLDSPKPNVANKNCWNCIHRDIEPGDDSVGMVAAVLCGIESPIDYRYDWYTILLEYLPRYSKDGEVATICPYYNPILVEQCCNCSKQIATPEHLHEIWAESYWGDAVPVCSTFCKEELEAKTRQEYQEYEQDMKYLRECSTL